MNHGANSKKDLWTRKILSIVENVSFENRILKASPIKIFVCSYSFRLVQGLGFYTLFYHFEFLAFLRLST